MENGIKNGNGLAKFVKSYWQILVFAAGMIVAWTMVQTTVANNKENIDTLQIKVQDIETIKGDIREINANIGFIKDTLYKKESIK